MIRAKPAELQQKVKLWWFGRLRNQVGLMILALVAGGVIGTTFVTTRSFLADKQEYVMVLNSITAPNAANAIGKHFAHLQEQLAVFDDILTSVQQSGKSSELLKSSFTKLQGVLQLDVYDENGLVASINPAQGSKTESHSPQLIGELTRKPGKLVAMESADGKALLLPVRIRQNVYIVRLDPAVFSEYLSLTLPLSGLLVLDDGVVVLGSTKGRDGATGAAVARELAKLSAKSDKQTVVAQKIDVAIDLSKDVSTDVSALAAIAPVPGVQGLSVVVHAPAEQVTQLARTLLNSSLPVIVFILIAALAVGAIFTGRLVRPIEELTEAAAQIGAGNWKVSLRQRSQDEIGRLVGAFSRMTGELSQREQELKTMHENLVRSERLAALGTFGAGIAHEVKNPLNSILGYSQLIEKKMSGGGDPTILKWIGFIMDETRRASRIISDLLSFARQKPPVLKPGRVSELLDYAYEMILPQAQAAHVRLEKTIEDPALQASFDREQLFQVLLNLCTNAFHALETKAASGEAVLSLSARQEGPEIAILVKDNGTGIAPENLAKLFEPFFSTKEVGKGTGLGLSLCHGIVTQHQGRITVTSQLGQGTEFKISLPPLSL